ncbi:MAG: hypothetical protein GY754_09890 [bacterium]|nr:hypothetical protein [bacterium]
MGWKVIKRKIGKAGGLKQRMVRQREWDRLYGEGNWIVGYQVKNEFIPQEEALDLIYYQSYVEHFASHPADLEELIATAKTLRNPHADATTGVDLQTPAILRYLKEQNLQLNGNDIVDIGSWQGSTSHKISTRLSPLHIKVTGNPKMTLEKFWQDKKCLAVWEED